MKSLTEQLLEFPTRIHPFDMYALLSETPDQGVIDVIKHGTADIPIDCESESYICKSPVVTVGGRTFVQTTTVPPITEGGRKLL